MRRSRVPLRGRPGSSRLAAPIASGKLYRVARQREWRVAMEAAVRRAIDRLTALGAPAELALWCMIETPLGVLKAAEIAATGPRVAALVAGTSDLAADLHARVSAERRPLMTALSLVLLAARAHG